MGFGTMRQLLKRLSPRSRAAPAPREGRRQLEIAADPDCTYAIGDVHGCIDKLRRLEQAILADAAAVEGRKLIVYLGDYIDRGIDSAAVIEHLLSPPPPDFHRVCLCGNHEEALIDVLEGRRSFDDWLQLGGERTLLSYGYDLSYMAKHKRARGGDALRHLLEAIPDRHVLLLKQLPSSFCTPSYFFAHAGIRPGIPLAEQRDDDLLWIREPFLSDGASTCDRIVVHGHTPSEAPTIVNKRIGVDTGAYMGGPLTAVRLSAGTVRFLQDR